MNVASKILSSSQIYSLSPRCVHGIKGKLPRGWEFICIFTGMEMQTPNKHPKYPNLCVICVSLGCRTNIPLGTVFKLKLKQSADSHWFLKEEEWKPADCWHVFAHPVLMVSIPAGSGPPQGSEKRHLMTEIHSKTSGHETKSICMSSYHTRWMTKTFFSNWSELTV